MGQEYECQAPVSWRDGRALEEEPGHHGAQFAASPRALHTWQARRSRKRKEFLIGVRGLPGLQRPPAQMLAPHLGSPGAPLPPADAPTHEKARGRGGGMYAAMDTNIKEKESGGMASRDDTGMWGVRGLPKPPAEIGTTCGIPDAGKWSPQCGADVPRDKVLLPCLQRYASKGMTAIPPREIRSLGHTRNSPPPHRTACPTGSNTPQVPTGSYGNESRPSRLLGGPVPLHPQPSGPSNSGCFLGLVTSWAAHRHRLTAHSPTPATPIPH